MTTYNITIVVKVLNQFNKNHDCIIVITHYGFISFNIYLKISIKYLYIIYF